VALATDENFVCRTAVALHSILTHASRQVEVTILQSGLSDVDKSNLQSLCPPFGVKMYFAEVKKERLRDLPVVSHRMSHAAYFRLLLPELVPGDVDKILYLDSDIVCSGDIAPLWDTDVTEYAVAATREPILIDEGRRSLFRRMFHSRADVIALNDASYFNTGVLLINLKKWRDARISERVLDWRLRNAHLTMLHDQDALNAVLDGDWLQLSVRWNFSPSYLRMTHFRFERHRQQLDPVIVHLSGGHGPARYRRLARRHLAAIEWAGRGDLNGPNEKVLMNLSLRAKRGLRTLHITVFPFFYGAAIEFGRRAPVRLPLQGDD
jgi:lipopolysaccharide biosynthesis glycosyltransferase